LNILVESFFFILYTNVLQWLLPLSSPLVKFFWCCLDKLFSIDDKVVHKCRNIIPENNTKYPNGVKNEMNFEKQPEVTEQYQMG